MSTIEDKVIREALVKALGGLSLIRSLAKSQKESVSLQGINALGPVILDNVVKLLGMDYAKVLCNEADGWSQSQITKALADPRAVMAQNPTQRPGNA